MRALFILNKGKWSDYPSHSISSSVGYPLAIVNSSRLSVGYIFFSVKVNLSYSSTVHGLIIILRFTTHGLYWYYISHQLVYIISYILPIVYIIPMGYFLTYRLYILLMG